MLAVRCGVSFEDHQLSASKDWLVLHAEVNQNFFTENIINAFQNPGSVHIFTSSTAVSMFLKLWNSFPEERRKPLKKHEVSALGVGSTTDTLVRSLQDQGPNMNWSFPELAIDGRRENGLLWTLEQLEKKGLLPKFELSLWCKTFSPSEKILTDYKFMRKWSNWRASVFEIYALTLRPDSMPQETVMALLQRTPVCFGVKSAEVLDATLNLIKTHLHKNSISEIPRNIHFSVWEKSALQRAQQLQLQSRLIPSPEFEELIALRERQNEI